MARTLLDPRSARRIAVSCAVIFGGAAFVGEGSLQNLSCTDCSIACDRTVLKGSYVRLAIFLPNFQRPLFVDLGQIQWVQGQIFGVQFERLDTLVNQSFARPLTRSP